MNTNEMRLIDANELVRKINKLDVFYFTDETDVPIYGCQMVELDGVLAELDEATTVDAVEVVHGHWISKGYKIECSVCGHRAFLGTHDPVLHTEEKNISKYCHNCGAKMDGERKDE